MCAVEISMLFILDIIISLTQITGRRQTKEKETTQAVKVTPHIN
jgi:hypothetical protein